MSKNYSKVIALMLITFLSLSVFSQKNQNSRSKFINLDNLPSKSINNTQQILTEYLNLSSDEELRKVKSEQDQLGFTHEKYQQYFSGIKVEFGTYLVHSKNGNVKSINGRIFTPSKIKLTPSLSKESAFQKAVNYVGASKYLWEENNPFSYTQPQGELVILPKIKGVTNESALVYKYDIYAVSPLYRAYVYVDANTGIILFENKRIYHADTPASGASLYNGTVSFTADSYNGTYRLRQTTDGNGIETYDMNNGTNYSAATDVTSSSTTFSGKETAVQAHFGAEKTHQYYMQKHGRNSFDNNGSVIKSYISYDVNYVNAYWNGSVMTYGDGDGVSYGPLVSLDIIGHEISHGITEYSANLTYSYESGALNESFSDIFGESIENFGQGSNDWLMGDDIGIGGSGAFRSMSNPNTYGDPDTYLGTNWVTGSTDSGGVHTNSGVQNFWYYLLTVGGSGTNDNGDAYSVTGIGLDKAGAIAYRNLTVYLTASSNYADARTGAIQAAVDLYGAGSAEEIATTNAWYAVGVGAEYVQTCSLAAPSSFAGSNIADNSFTLSWNTVTGAASYDVSVGGSTYNVSGTTYNATGLTAGTTYNCTVVANCSVGGSGTSSSVSVTTTGTAPVNYCTSASTNVNDEYIGRVQLNTIDNASGAQFYTDFTNISTSLTKGNQYSITVTPTWTGTVYNEAYAVWIDYNYDGDFDDAGELVWSKAASKDTPNTGTFSIPTSAVDGATRMRVSMKYNAIPTACETFTYGEVEDYTVILSAGTPDTTAPIITLNGAASINLNVGDTYTEQGATASDNIDGDISANIVIGGDAVNTNTAGTYVVTYNVSDAAGNAATEVTRTVTVTVVADTTAPVITLVGAASINLNVGDTYTEQGATATDNVDGDISANIVIGGDTVNTNAAGTYVVTYNVSDAAGNAATEVTRTVTVNTVSTGGCTGGVTSYPYNQGFENTLGSWTQSSSDDFDWSLRSGSTPSSSTGPSSAVEGSYYVYMESSSPNYSTKRAILNSPCFDLSGESQATMTFKYHMYGSTSMGSLALEVSTDNGSSWSSIWSKSGNQGNSWLTATLDLATYIGGTVQFRFNGITGTTWQGDMAVDALQISNGSTGGGTCEATTLSITFDNYPEETSYDIKDANGAVVFSGGTYGSQADGSTLTIPMCLDAGCYTFTLYDSYGDGICCSYGSGSYSYTKDSDGTVLASGGSFTSSDATAFCINTTNLYSINSFDRTVIPDIVMYPNPVTDYLFVELKDQQMNRYTITNLMGQIIASGELLRGRVDVNELETGVYIIEFNSDKKNISRKFIKQ